MAMCVGIPPGMPGLFSREGTQPPSCVDTAFGISLEKGQERLYIPGIALLPYKNISSCTYFLEGFFFFLEGCSLCFYALLRKGKETNAIGLRQEGVHVIWQRLSAEPKYCWNHNIY